MLKAWAPFLALAAVSVAYSLEPSLSGQRLASGLFVIIGFGLGIPLFFPRLHDLEKLAKQVVLLLVVGVLFSLYASPQDPTETYVRGRISGVFNNPNTLGLLAMQASLILLYWWQTETHRLRRYSWSVPPSSAASPPSCSRAPAPRRSGSSSACSSTSASAGRSSDGRCRSCSGSPRWLAVA